VHTEAQTFMKKALAQACMKRCEAVLDELRTAGDLNQDKITVGDLRNA